MFTVDQVLQDVPEDERDRDRDLAEWAAAEMNAAMTAGATLSASGWQTGPCGCLATWRDPERTMPESGPARCVGINFVAAHAAMVSPEDSDLVEDELVIEDGFLNAGPERLIGRRCVRLWWAAGGALAFSMWPDVFRARRGEPLEKIS